MSAIDSVKKHKWAATGVSGYPLSHPIVGQTRFYQQFEHFIHLVDDEAEKFAHVFAVVAQWGIGKSRLAYELMSQINDTSQGWYVRDTAGQLVEASLFRNDADREQYLGLYIRYSQVATESHNIDNWFGYGLYKALLPLTKGHFDTSIRGQIAKEAYDRLLVKGFDENKLAAALEVAAHHSDEQLYDDPDLVTRLCQAAYDYLRKFGVKYLLIALDELETAAEAATYGLEVGDLKYLDGRAIKLIGKAIKEEDPRGKLPWLRYVALCSPAIGNELRDIRSTARRFEIVELAQNPFADVSSFVELLKNDGRLAEAYPAGLVEAAYAMSGGNFGWFNVVMANIDGVIAGRRARRETGSASAGSLFDETVRVSSRMGEYVLDHQAVAELNIGRDFLDAAKELLYGQLPVPLVKWNDDQRQALLAATNEYGEPIAVLYQKVEWSDHDCGKALRAAKFNRDRDDYVLSEVDQPLDLTQLLANLSTYSIHETKGAVEAGGKRTLLIPLNAASFVHLVSMLYPHPAAEDAARALWREQIGADAVSSASATHVGPSIDMLARLNLRLRRQGATSLILREPDQSAAHEKAIEACKGQSQHERALQILTGAMRALDENWDYDAIDAGLKGDVPAITTAGPKGPGGKGGLVDFNALHLHPEGKLILAWVQSVEELTELCDKVSAQRTTAGRVPVLAFTSSRHLWEQFHAATAEKLRVAHEYLLLYQLSSREEYVLHPIGLAKKDWQGFQLHYHRFTTAFSNRLQALVRPLREAANQWRRELDRRGRIAWPLRVSGVLREEDREALFQAYRRMLVDSSPPKALVKLDETSGLDPEQVRSTLERMRVSARAKAAGYLESERCGLFSTHDESAEPELPAFLYKLCQELIRRDPSPDREWSMELAEREWFWGYTWEGARPNDIYMQWLALACTLGFAEETASGSRRTDKRYALVPRAALEGALAEARNWLNDEYPKIVKRMKSVFGPGKVGEYFAPLGESTPGTKTLLAKEQLDIAQSCLSRLAAAEPSWNDAQSEAEKRDLFVDCARSRLAAREKTEHVYSADEYKRLTYDDSIRTLNFEADGVPLWKRIRQADLFVDFVLKGRDRIKKRSAQVAEEMRKDVESIAGFPVQVFVRSLAKIANILEGSIGERPAEGDTQKAQYLSPGTLGQALRDLKVAQAADRLGQLAAEVGVPLDSDHDLPLADINGSIAGGFRELKRNYEAQRKLLEDLTVRLNRLAAVLADAPDDFKYPTSLPGLDELRARPPLIERTITETLAADIEDLISEHDGTSRLGNFQPLMEETKKLLVEPKRALAMLAGQVTTLENAEQDYRRRLLENDELQSIEQGFNALRQVKGQVSEKPLDVADLEAAGSLHAARQLVAGRCAEWTAKGEPLLDGAGISFATWRAIVEELAAGRTPALAGDQVQRLVDNNYLRVTYRLGGGQE
ncbi:MAG TPA: hypothetical protein VNH11_21730 [Pirellulales bacterium]|nr:hypothetical protein [Pirellulales bacterium]